MLIYSDDVVHKSLLLNGLRPDDMDRVTMCGMVELFHSCGVLTNDSLDVPLRLGVVKSDLEATIENLELVKPRLGCCYNELHNVFWLKCVFRIKALFGFCPKAKGVCPRLCACIDRQDRQPPSQA